jgi:folate-binding protein YgfZ
VLAAALGLPTGALTALDAGAHLPWPHGLVAARQNRDLPTYLVTIRGTERVDRVARDLGAAGAVQVSDAAVEGMRLMEGRPRFGADMNEETIPLEAGLLDRAISTTKGCYVGQEIVIRILHRGGGRVAKRLATLSLDAAAAASQPGAVLRDRDRPVGALTSVARSPRTGKPIALGYVARDAAVEGAVVGIDGGGRATITGFAR